MNIILFDDIPKFISLTDIRGKHLKKVLKLREGDSFRAGLVDGPLGEVLITATGSEGYEVEWKETTPAVEPHPLSMIVGFVRPISVKRILREAASLGVGRLIFTVTDTGERSYREANLWKTGEYRDYLVNGLQTAGATVLPEVVLTGGVDEAIREVKRQGLREVQSRTSGGGEARFVLDKASGAPFLGSVKLPVRDVVLAVGSERGWSERERCLFEGEGFQTVGLGRRVLRTETACSVGAALALAGMGLLDS